MKKRIISIWITLVFSLGVITASAGLLSAQASPVLDELDNLFRTTLSEILEYENSDDTYISAQKELLYDIHLNPLGVLYEFTHDTVSGYAIIINNGSPTVTEIYLDAQSPYHHTDSIKIYVVAGIYWEYDGNDYYDTETGLPVSEDTISTITETAFFGAFDLYYSSEQINYLYRSETKYNILSSIPTYIYGLTNGCVPIAGTNLIAYYDKTYTNLIPNYDPGITFLGQYRFKAENATTMALSETLYYDMGTNINSAGTTVTQFKNGLKSYVNRQGYSVSYTSLMSWGSINYDSAKTVVQNNKGIALFLGGYRSTVITNNDGYDVLAYEYASDNHAVAGFGCLDVNYTLTNNQSRTDKYIHASMGVGLYRNGYINVGTANIDEALVLNIS